MRRAPLHQCGACCYWSPHGGDTGLCRIRAPIAVPAVNVETRPIPETDEAPASSVDKVFASKRLAIWPLTGAADWCGEFRQGDMLGGA